MLHLLTVWLWVNLRGRWSKALGSTLTCWFWLVWEGSAQYLACRGWVPPRCDLSPTPTPSPSWAKDQNLQLRRWWSRGSVASWWHCWLVSTWEICRSDIKGHLPLSECLLLFRSVNPDGANPEDDSHVGLVWDLSLHGSYITQWYPAVGSYAASAHP